MRVSPSSSFLVSISTVNIVSRIAESPVHAPVPPDGTKKFLICSHCGNRNSFMRTTIRTASETPWERAKMEQIVRADIAAFGSGRAEMANAMIEQSGIRVRPDRNRGRSAGINPTGRFEPVTRHVFDDGWEIARGSAAVQDRSAGGEAAHHHHAQRVARHLLRPLDQSLSRLRARLRLLLRAADPQLSWACRRGWTSNRSCSPSRTRRSCSTRSCRRKATSRAPSPSAPTPIPTSRSRSNGASCARSSKCSTRATIRSAS